MKRIIILLGFSTFLIACNGNEHQTMDTVAQENCENLSQDSIATQLPFIGKKQFETRVGIAGTGTPNKFVEIKKNGDVYFSFGVIGQDTTIEENYYAGKFQKYLKCVFKKIDDSTYYEITKEKIYEVDRNHNRLTGPECCNSSNQNMGDKCPCEGLFSTFE